VCLGEGRNDWREMSCVQEAHSQAQGMLCAGAEDGDIWQVMAVSLKWPATAAY
jgi:uncharacterized protein YgfB (UPF0149 family)